MRIIRITLSMLVLSAATCAAQDVAPYSPSKEAKSIDSLLDLEFKLTPVELDISEELIKAKDHYENGEWQSAVEFATRFLKNKPGHKQTPDGLFLRGESNVQLQRYQDVLSDFNELLQSNANLTQRIRAEFRIAEATMLLRQPEEAQRLLEQFRQRYPNDKLNAYVLTYLGEIIGRTNTDWAKALYVESLQRYPNGPLYRRAKLRLALIRFKEGNHTIARSDLEQLIETGDRNNPEYWTAWYWLGRAELKNGQTDAAIDRFLSFSEQFPNHEYSSAAVFQAAEAFRTKENSNRAIELYQQLRQTWPDSEYKGPALLGEMRVLKQQGQHQTALNLFESFDNYSSAETRMQATQIATEIYLAKKSYERAEELISPYATVPQSLRTEAERTRHYTNLYLLALAHRGQGKYSIASEMLGRVRLESVSSDLSERVMLARIETFVAAEEYNEANQTGFEFEGRFANSELLPAVRAQMIRSFVATKRNSEAYIKFRQLQNMQDAETYTARAARFLGETAYQQEDFDNARIIFEALQRQQQSDDDLAQSMSGLAWIDYKQKKTASAAKGFAQFIEAFSDHPTIWKVRLAHAESLTKLNKNEAAIETLGPFETLPLAHPLRARGLYQLADLLKRDPQQEGRVSQLLAQILSDHPTFEQRDAALYLSAMQDRKQKMVSANTKFKELVQQHPSSKYWSDALYRLAETAHSQQDNTTANKYLTKLISAERDKEVLPHALFMKGRLESDAENWPVARETLRDLLRKFPNSKLVPVARYGVAESFFQEKEFDRAFQLFEILKREQKFDKANTWGAMVQLRCAQLEVQRKNLVAATTVARQIEGDHPNFPLQHEVDYLIGRVAAARGEFSEARIAYEKVVAKDSAYEREISAMAQWMIGETYFHQKKYILAIKAYEALVADLKFDNWQAASHLQIGKCYELLDNPEQAQNSYSRVTTRHGQTKWAEEAKQRLDVIKQAS